MTLSEQRVTHGPWFAMALILGGSFLIGLDRMMVNVTLPDIGAEFAGQAGLDIVVSGYFLAIGVAQPGTGWLADRFGKKPVYLVALGSFTVASLLAGIAPNLALLIAARLLQGLSAGAMLPLSIAMVYELFPPHRRGRAFGVWGFFAMVSPALGPVVGGAITTSFSWRWAFLLNVPVGLLILPIAGRFLRDPSGPGDQRRLDLRAWIYVGIGLPAVLFAVSLLGNRGGLDLDTGLLLLGGCVFIGAFLWRSTHVAHPLLDVRMARLPAFASTMAVQWLVSIPYTTQLVFVPLLLVTFRGMTPLEAGLIVTASAVGSMVTMQVAGRLVDRFDVRFPIMVGTGMLAAASLLLTQMGSSAAVPTLVAIMVLQGMGGGMTLMPLTVGALDAVDDALVAQASALRSLNKMVAQAVGVSAMTALLVAYIGADDGASLTNADPARAAAGYATTFTVMFWMLVVGLALSVALPHGPRAGDESADDAVGEPS